MLHGVFLRVLTCFCLELLKKILDFISTRLISISFWYIWPVLLVTGTCQKLTIWQKLPSFYFKKSKLYRRQVSCGWARFEKRDSILNFETKDLFQSFNVNHCTAWGKVVNRRKFNWKWQVSTFNQYLETGGGWQVWVPGVFTKKLTAIKPIWKTFWMVLQKYVPLWSNLNRKKFLETTRFDQCENGWLGCGCGYEAPAKPIIVVEKKSEERDSNKVTWTSFVPKIY